MIKLNNVSFKYQEEEIIKKVNLNIEEGSFNLILGKSGCGKSTLLKIINGIIPHHIEGDFKGDVLVNNQNIIDLSIQEIAQTVGSVFQNPKSQFFHLNTTDELIFSASNQGVEKDEIKKRLKDLVVKFNLEDLLDRNIFNLSGGQKQKIACASTCLGQPKVLVLDEPSSNLDQKSIYELKTILSILKDEGYTIIVAEHRLHYLIDLCDNIFYLAQGEISKKYTVDEFKKISKEKRQQLGLRSLNYIDLKEHPFCIKNNHELKLAIENLNYAYKSGFKLNIPYLNLQSQDVLAIIGNNGVGKSTFAKCLTGLYKCKGIKINNLETTCRQRQKSISFVMQDVNHQLFTNTVYNELLLDYNRQEILQPDEINHVLEKLELKNFLERHPLSLSGGQKQRLVIANAILSKKDIFIFDEPTSGLDYYHMQQVSALINQLKKLNKIIILITHDYELINQCCNKVYELKKS